MISRTHRVVFVHVPKCAGMSVEACLGGLPGPQRPEQHFRGHDYQRLYPSLWRRYHRFAIVRHPVARCWSYVRFIRRFDPVWRRRLRDVDDAALLSDLLMSANLLTNRSCHAMLTGEEEVLKQEELRDAWPRFAAAHGLPEQLPRLNHSRAPAQASDPPAWIQLMVEALFPEDYDRFGYARSGIDVADLPPHAQGPVWWARLRRIALVGAEPHGAPERAETDGAIARWVDDLPEDTWRETWHRAMADHPIPPDPSLLVHWTEDLHDAVNHQLGKPLWEAWRP